MPSAPQDATPNGNGFHTGGGIVRRQSDTPKTTETNTSEKSRRSSPPNVESASKDASQPAATDRRNAQEAIPRAIPGRKATSNTEELAQNRHIMENEGLTAEETVRGEVGGEARPYVCSSYTQLPSN